MTAAPRFVWLPEEARACAVSPDGRWVSVEHADRLAVYEYAAQREVCAWPRGNGWVQGFWCDADAMLVRWHDALRERTARVVVPDGGELVARDGTPTRDMLLAVPRGDFAVRLALDDDLRPVRVEVLDPHTLATLRSVALAEVDNAVEILRNRLLLRPDGAALLIPLSRTRGREQLACVDLHGGGLRPVPKEHRWPSGMAWLAPSRVLRWRAADLDAAGWIELVDLDTGDVLWRRSDSGLVAAAPAPGMDRVALVLRQNRAFVAQAWGALGGDVGEAVVLRATQGLRAGSLRWRAGDQLEGALVKRGRWTLARWSLATGRRVWEVAVDPPAPGVLCDDAAACASDDGAALAWTFTRGHPDRNTGVPHSSHVGWCLDGA